MTEQSSDNPGDEALRLPPLEWDHGTIRALAPAKLNLTLHIGPRRGDGFHELVSLVVKIDLCDALTFALADDGSISLTCLPQPPCETERNLVHRAAMLLRERCGVDAGAVITLTKRVPDGAGLGGGSADAALTLTALNELWGCGLSAADLAGLGAELGSDVPLSFAPPACVMSGRGERIAAARAPEFIAVLLTPEIHCPTGAVYAAYDEANTGTDLDVEAARRLAETVGSSTDPAADWPGLLTNDLAEPAMTVRPQLRATAEAFAAAGGRAVHVTGSGSGLFVICPDRKQAEETLAALPQKLRLRSRIVGNNPW